MRVEVKFLLNFLQYSQFKQRIQLLSPEDKNTLSGGGYPVFSQYYDDQKLTDLHDKLDGEANHKKIRTRRYSTNFREAGKSFFLESKVKTNKVITKIRLGLPKDVEEFSEDLWEIMRSDKAEYFKNLFQGKRLRPTCNVFYWREAYEFNSGDIKFRLNFDTNLLYLFKEEYNVTREHLETRNMLRNYYCILEIKYFREDFPEFLKKELWHIGATKTSFSKYASAIQALEYNYGRLSA